jgi:hypothetical protein
MNISLSLFMVFGAICAATTLILLAYRAKLTYREDTSIHMNLAESALADRQITVARRLEWIDRLGPIFTAIVLLYALILATVFIYVPWVSARLPIVF